MKITFSQSSQNETKTNTVTFHSKADKVKLSASQLHEAKHNKHLLNIELIVGIVSFVLFLATILFAVYYDMSETNRVIVVSLSTLFLLLISFALLKIEQAAGYYRCSCCEHRHTPSYMSVLFAPHFFRIRYLKCPECNKKSWQKKVLYK